MNRSSDDSARECETASDSEFESYYDRDSGTWSLRRVPSAPPPSDDSTSD